MLTGLAVSQAEEARTVPVRAGDGAGGLRQAPVGGAVPAEGALLHDDAVENAAMLAREDCAGLQALAVWDRRDRRRVLAGPALARGTALLVVPGDLVEIAGGLAVEVAEGVRLD